MATKNSLLSTRLQKYAPKGGNSTTRIPSTSSAASSSVAAPAALGSITNAISKAISGPPLPNSTPHTDIPTTSTNATSGMAANSNTNLPADNGHFSSLFSSNGNSSLLGYDSSKLIMYGVVGLVVLVLLRKRK